jgi:hypothetical protein
MLAVAACLAVAPAAWAQRRPYIGYTYPAGGQIATTFQIKLGGQDLDDVDAVRITGSGVTARVVEYYRKLGPQEIQLLNEQLRELKRATPPAAAPMAPKTALDEAAMLTAATTKLSAAGADKTVSAQTLIAKIEQRTREWVQVPACASISSIVIAEITVAPDAEPGVRELRLATPRGVSNPLVFHVGSLPEYSRKPMITASIQILGKEALALRKRPAGEIEDRIDLPCTVNGQIASGEVNRYRFHASKGQRLVISTQARELIPYVADAVPGWFQPVIVLSDARGKEVAFADDYRFKPDPVILYQAPDDGDYTIAIYDSIYRGREDFVYRMTIGELPFVTSLFPLGGPAGAALPPNATGWNIEDADLGAPPKDAPPGLQRLAAYRMGYASNRVPFVLDRLPEVTERESNNSAASAQTVALPVIINGRIDQPDDWDVFQFTGKAYEKIVVEVQARRLESPLDSVIKLTDAAGKLLAFNDDHEDLAAGVNTHHADSYLATKLPADGNYFVHIGDTARKGGVEYGYRLRMSAPQPDFELRIVPSSVSLPINSTTALTVYAARKDGFAGPIKLTLKDPTSGFSAAPVTLPANQTTARIAIKAGAVTMKEPVRLSIIGTAKVGEQEIVRTAIAAEDRMQAFLWRHLVPASDLQVVAFDPRVPPPPKRIAPERPAVADTTSIIAAVAARLEPAGANGSATPPSAASTPTPPKPKFTKQQIVGRLRQLKLLYEEGLLTDDFYLVRVAECETSQ